MSGYSVSYKDFLTDPERRDVYLVELSPYDEATPAVETLYYSSDIYVSGPADTPAGQPYVPQAIVALNIEQGIVLPGTVRDTPPVSGGEVRIAQMFGSTDALDGYLWNGRAAKIIHVGYSPTGNGWVSRANGRVLYDGEVESIQIGLEEVTIALRDQGARLQGPMQSAALIGSGWMLNYDGSTTVATTTGPEPKLTALVDDITVEFFIYCEDSTPAAVTNIVGLSGTTWPWEVQLTAAGKIRFRSNATTYYTTTAGLSDKKWFHVTVACDATSTIVYLHDVAGDATTVETDAADNTGRAAASADASFNIGGRPSPATDRIDGYVTQVRVWNVKRTEAEIREARFRRLTEGEETDATLVGLWRGEDGPGDGTAATNALMEDASTIVTTQATLTADETAGVYSYTRASGSFVTDGWVAGMRGRASGFGTAGNNGLFTVSTAVALTLTVTGITLVDEASVVAALLTSAPLSIAYSGAPVWVASLEGSPDTAGTLRPLAFGRCESVPGVLVHVPTATYMVAGNICEEVVAAYAGGVLHGKTGDPDLPFENAYTDLRTFLLAETTAGLCETLTYAGGTFVRFGSQPSFPVTFDLKGDNTATAVLGAQYENYQETTAGIAWKVATLCGTEPLVNPDELDYASFEQLDIDNSAPCGVYAFGSETIAEIIAFVLGSVGAAGYFDRQTGLFTVQRFGGQAGSYDAAFDERTVISVTPESVDPPMYAVALGYRRQYTTLGLEDIAGEILQNDDPIVARLTQGYLTARVEDLAVLARFPRAGTYVADTGLALESDAIAEATRRLGLYGGAAKAYKITIPDAESSNAGEGWTVQFTLAEFDQDGQPLQRLGLIPSDPSSLFIVLHVAPLSDEEGVPQVEVTIWKGGG